MNASLFSGVIVSIVMLLLVVVPVFLLRFIFNFKTRTRKSPLSVDLLRNSGESLRDKIEELNTDIVLYLILIPFALLSLFTSYLVNAYYFGKTIDLGSYLLVLIFVVGFCCYWAVRLYRMFIYRNKLRLGYDCEVYVGQNLMNGLMSHGFKVYHDFPATDTFNIDHIAVGPTGVFAIETKGRAKQVTIEKDNWQVTFDGTKLIFPSWTEDRPVIQATAQAKWLSEWLSSATGQPVTVSPVLAIPGWFVKMKGYTGLKIYNGKNPEFLAKPAKGQLFLDGQAIQSISHQLEAKCRDIKSTAYRKD